MRARSTVLILALVFTASAAFAATRTIRIFDKRQIVIGVPEGWKFNLSKNNQTGVQTMQLDDRSGDVKVTASFFPDANDELSTEEALDARMRDLFAPVSEETTFTFTKTVDGNEGHAAIGDATKGIRAWPGVFVVFTITGDPESEAHWKAIEVLREGMREVAK